MQKATANGEGTRRFLSKEDINSLRETAIRIEALSQHRRELRDKLGTSDHGTIQDLMNGTKPDQPLIDEITRVDTELEELKNTAMRQGLLLTADTALDQWIRPYVKLARQAAGPAAEELAEIIGILYGAGLDMVDGLKTVRKRGAESTAGSRKMKLDAYIKAGFSRREAFSMVLAEIKPPDFAALNQAAQKVQSSADGPMMPKTAKRKGTNGSHRAARDS